MRDRTLPRHRPRKRRPVCGPTAKVCYTQEEATLAAAELVASGGKDGVTGIAVYHCLRCSHFHVGHRGGT
jgi:hypothetical protein